MELSLKTTTAIFRLALMLLIFGLSSCAGKDKAEKTPDRMTELLRQEILTVVTDTDRANEAAELADELRQTFSDAEKQYEKDFATFRSLNANYNAKETAFQAFFMNMNTTARARQRRVLAIRTKMKTLITAEEWKQLSEVRKDALEVNLKQL